MLAAAPKYREMCSQFAEAPRENRKILAKEMELFEQEASRRIFLALVLLHLPEVVGKIDHAEQATQECKALLPALQQLESQVAQAVEAGGARDQLVQLLNQLSERGQDESLIDSIRQAMQSSSGLLASTRAALKNANYPFDHAKGKISIADYVLPKLPNAEDPVAICHALDAMIDSVFQLKARMTGQLCVVAENVESAIGLEPLPEHSEPEESTS